MDIALPSFILGYHGCDASVAEAVFAGRASLKPSTNDYDWLADGVYFWEHNAQRAFEFARQMAAHPHPSGQRIERPAVVGAVINLGYCLNLLDTTHIDMVRRAYADLSAALHANHEPIPENSGGRDLVSRKLDCAVIDWLHVTRRRMELPAFDTVRAAFFEGERLYDNAGFAAGNHIQVAVRDPRRILGYFRPLDENGRPRSFS